MVEYKGFELEEYLDEDKAKALIDYLELSGDEDTLDEQGNNYYVNKRKVKRGDPPGAYKKAVTNFKELLSQEEKEIISGYIKIMGTINEQQSEYISDSAYKEINESLETMRKEVNDDEAHPLRKAYKECEKHAMHVSNILYHLLYKKKDREEVPDYVKSYRSAWNDEEVVDYRETTEEYEEYLVLSDEEADELCDDYLEDGEYEYYWREAVKAERTLLGYEEWKQEVREQDGRGSILSNYDGDEVEQGDFYIYRVN